LVILMDVKFEYFARVNNCIQLMVCLRYFVLDYWYGSTVSDSCLQRLTGC